MMACPNCGEGLPDRTAYCDYCGADLLGNPSSAYNAQGDVLVNVGMRTQQSESDSAAANTFLRPRETPLPNAPEPQPVGLPIADTPTSAAVQSSMPTPPQIAYKSVDTKSTLPEPPPLSLDKATASSGGLGGDASADEARRRVVQLIVDRRVFQLTGKEQYILGRRDTEKNTSPDVDLHDWNGADRGVSRHHALIRTHHRVIAIEDLNSRNSTILNGKRLYPYQQYELLNNSEIRLGDITLTVKIII